MPTSTLPVLHRTQTADGYCLPACAQMVLAYRGIEANQTALARQLGVIDDVGLPASRILRLNSPTIKVEYRASNAVDVTNPAHALRDALARNIPPILFVTTGELPYWDGDTAHALVLVGMDDVTALVNDPAFDEAPIIVGVGDLLLAWDASANALALIERQ